MDNTPHACARCGKDTRNPKYCGVQCSLNANRRANPPVKDTVVDGLVHRECRVCARIIERETGFRRQANRCGGFHTRCKSCDRAALPRSMPAILAACRRYYLRHGDEVRLRNKRWRLAHPDKVMARNRRRVASERNALIQHVTAHMLRQRASVFGNSCAYCDGPHEHWDHVIPISRGGKHCLANLRPACAHCNLTKHNKTLSEWIQKRG